MIRQLLVFLIVWALVALGLSTWRNWTGRGAWHVTKILGFGFLTAAVASIVLGLIVAFF